MQIRRAASRDYERLAVLFRAFLLELRDISGDDYFDFADVSLEVAAGAIADFSRAENGRIYVAADDGGQIKGFIIGTERPVFLPLSGTKKIGYIEALYVRPECRREGLACVLEEALTKYFRSCGYRYVELNVLSRNVAAGKYWERADYTVFREQYRKKL